MDTLKNDRLIDRYTTDHRIVHLGDIALAVLVVTGITGVTDVIARVLARPGIIATIVAQSSLALRPVRSVLCWQQIPYKKMVPLQEANVSPPSPWRLCPK